MFSSTRPLTLAQCQVECIWWVSGYSATRCGKEQIRLFLAFPKPPHKSIVHGVMRRMVAAAENTNMPCLVLVGDQPVYA